MTDIDQIRFTSQTSSGFDPSLIASCSSASIKSPNMWGATPANYNFKSNKSALSNNANYDGIKFDDIHDEKKRLRISSASSQSDTQHIDAPSKISGESSKGKRKRPKFIRKVICLVCGDVANDHMHYGAIACYSCRAFFRRGVKTNAPYFCSQSQTCVINKQSRKHCQYCRFQKCLEIGMKPTFWTKAKCFYFVALISSLIQKLCTYYCLADI